MDDVHKHITNGECYGKLLLTFTNERLFLRLALFNLAANKLPKESSCFVCRSLTDHKLVLVPYQGRYNFRHMYPPA